LAAACKLYPHIPCCALQLRFQTRRARASVSASLGHTPLPLEAGIFRLGYGQALHFSYIAARAPTPSARQNAQFTSYSHYYPIKRSGSTVGMQALNRLHGQEISLHHNDVIIPSNALGMQRFSWSAHSDRDCPAPFLAIDPALRPTTLGFRTPRRKPVRPPRLRCSTGDGPAGARPGCSTQGVSASPWVLHVFVCESGR
jgi:hypothetical protein